MDTVEQVKDQETETAPEANESTPLEQARTEAASGDDDKIQDGIASPPGVLPRKTILENEQIRRYYPRILLAEALSEVPTNSVPSHLASSYDVTSQTSHANNHKKIRIVATDTSELQGSDAAPTIV